MAKKKTMPLPPLLLNAAIREIERTYYISQETGVHARVEDEAILSVTAMIEEISPAQRRFLGRTLEMSFMRARTFRSNEPEDSTGQPFFMPIQLRKDRCSLAAYLPADAFWALPDMISSKAVTHVEARFSAPVRGSGTLLSIYFAPATLIDPIE